jgi:hypothetical protein
MPAPRPGWVFVGAVRRHFPPVGRRVERVDALAVYARPLAATLGAFGALAAVHALPVGLRGDVESGLVLAGAVCRGLALEPPRVRWLRVGVTLAAGFWVGAPLVGLLVAGGAVGLPPAPPPLDAAMVLTGLLWGGLDGMVAGVRRRVAIEGAGGVASLRWSEIAVACLVLGLGPAVELSTRDSTRAASGALALTLAATAALTAWASFPSKNGEWVLPTLPSDEL